MSEYTTITHNGCQTCNQFGPTGIDYCADCGCPLNVVYREDAERWARYRARDARWTGFALGAMSMGVFYMLLSLIACAPTNPSGTVDEQRIEQQREHAARDAAVTSARDEYVTTSDPYGGAFYVKQLKVFTKNVAWFKDITTDWPYQKVEPGKRMLSSQSPVLVTCNGRIALITGSPGGRTILSTVLGILVDQLIFQTTLEDALDAPRLHHQWLPDRIQFEGANDPRWAPLLAALRELGHQVVPASHERGQGSAHSISVDPHLGLRTGIADTRRGGAAAGQ
jgi:hypothetical protein